MHPAFAPGLGHDTDMGLASPPGSRCLTLDRPGSVTDTALPSQFVYSSEPLALADVAPLCDAVDQGTAVIYVCMPCTRTTLHRQPGRTHEPGSLSCGSSGNSLLRLVHGVQIMAVPLHDTGHIVPARELCHLSANPCLRGGSLGGLCVTCRLIAGYRVPSVSHALD